MNKLAKWLFGFTAGKPVRFINRYGEPYLERYFLFENPFFVVYLHRFVGPDGDIETHDHPFTAFSAVLTGRYQEERVTEICILRGIGITTRWIRFFNIIRSRDFHRIVQGDPETWTLFIHTKRRGRDWGFLRSRKMTNNSFEISYHNPFKVTEDRDKWWLKAPLGRDSDRVPFGNNNGQIRLCNRSKGG